MKQSFFFLAVLIGMIFPCSAQNPSWQWANSISDSTSAARAFNCADSQGSVYFTGCYNSPSIVIGTYTLTNNSLNSRWDTYIAKFDRNGIVLWAKNFGGDGDDLINDLYIDKQDRVYIGGQFSSQGLILDSFSLTVSTTTASMPDIFYAVLDGNGVVQQAAAFGGPKFDQLWSIAGDKNGVTIGGSFANPSLSFPPFTLTNSSSDNSSDFFIVRLDHAGNVLWAVSGGSAGSEGIADLATDEQGNTYCCIVFPTQVTVGNSTYVCKGDLDFVLAKYNAIGALVWSQHSGGTGREWMPYLACNDKGEVFFNGYSTSPTFTLDGHIVTHPNNFSAQSFSGKINQQGTVVWLESAHGDEGGAVVPGGIALDAYGNLFTAGYLSGDTAYFKGAKLINSVTGKKWPETDIYIVKHDGEGNRAWIKKVGAAGADLVHSLSTDNNNSFFISGYHQNTVQLDQVMLANNFIGVKPFLAKYGFVNLTSVQENNLEKRLEAYPNPFEREVEIHFPGTGPRTLFLYDGQGKQVACWLTTEATVKLNCDKQSQGVYLLRTRSEKGEQQTLKLIKQ